MLETRLGPRVRQLVDWYDSLMDRERVKYGIFAMLFLLACSGYLLGLGSTILVRRVEAESAVAAQRALPAGAGVEGLVNPNAAANATPTPTASSNNPLLTAPGITEVPLVPRMLPEEPQPSVPTPSKPRNLELASPQPTLGTRTPTPARTGTPVGTPGLTGTRTAGTATPSLYATPPALATFAPTATPAPRRQTPVTTPAPLTRPAGTPTPASNLRPSP